MLHMFLHALFGLIVGLVARAVLPGADHHGLIVTAIIGIVGGWFGGQIGRWLGWYNDLPKPTEPEPDGIPTVQCHSP